MLFPAGAADAIGQEVPLEEFHKRIPEYRLADGATIRFSPGIRQAETLPLVFGS